MGRGEKTGGSLTCFAYLKEAVAAEGEEGEVAASRILDPSSTTAKSKLWEATVAQGEKEDPLSETPEGPEGQEAPPTRRGVVLVAVVERPAKADLEAMEGNSVAILEGEEEAVGAASTFSTPGP